MEEIKIKEEKRIIPDFIIIGAAKSGTTALSHFLNQHPDIFMTANKEPRFFTSIEGDMVKKITGDGPRLSGNYSKGFKWYLNLFKDALIYQQTGEASTVYFCNEDASKLIYENVPNVKLIVMLRHPVKRIYSHYWQENKLGFNFPSFEQMVIENHPRIRYYKKVSHYKINLERYLKYFKKEQLYILIHEEFVKNPEKQFYKVLDFLNVEPFKINLEKKINEQVVAKSKLFARAMQIARNYKIKNSIPETLFKILRKIKGRLTKFNVKSFTYPSIPAHIFKLLMNEHIDDIYFVEQFLGRDLSEWNIA